MGLYLNSLMASGKEVSFKWFIRRIYKSHVPKSRVITQLTTYPAPSGRKRLQTGQNALVEVGDSGCCQVPMIAADDEEPQEEACR